MSTLDEAVCNGIDGWFPPPYGLDAVKERFGAIAVEGDQIIAPHGWESANMVKVADLPGWGPRGLYVNKAIVPMLREALHQCCALGDGYPIKTLGCFSPRAKRGLSSLSLHSWGIAVDLNADDNPLVIISSADDLAKRRKTIPDTWIAIFKSVGFTWGGDFHSRYDPQHLQFASGV